MVLNVKILETALKLALICVEQIGVGVIYINEARGCSVKLINHV